MEKELKIKFDQKVNELRHRSWLEKVLHPHGTIEHGGSEYMVLKTGQGYELSPGREKDTEKYIWYRVWKEHHGHLSAEDYRKYPDWMDEEDLKYEVQNWASEVNYDGAHTSFKYGYDKLDKPPKEWIEQRIIKLQSDILHKQKQIIELENL